MAYQTGTAANYLDMLNTLLVFLTGVGSIGTPTSAGDLLPPVANTPTTSNTGGTLAAAIHYYVVTALNGNGETLASNEVSVDAQVLGVTTATMGTTATTGGTLAAATYYYVVTALGAQGETLASNEVSQTTTGTTSTVSLSWTAVSGATGYRVYRGTAAAGESVYYDVGNVTSYTDTGATSTAGTPPGTNTATTNTNQNTLTWAAVSGATSYRVYRGTAAGAENVYFTAGNVTTFTDTGAAGTAGAPPATDTASTGMVGTGTLSPGSAHAATKTETWTISCTGGTAGAENWTVVGSVSGAQANATTGVAYDNGLLGFTINAGATPYAEYDTYTVPTTAGAVSALGQAWTILSDTSPNDTGVVGLGASDVRNREVYLKATGLAGADQIYVNIRAFELAGSDYFNWQFAGANAYVAANAFLSQPNSSPPQHVYLWNQPIKYWLYASGRCFVLVMKINNVYQHMYCGLGLPFGRPEQYPYPLLIGGCGNTVDQRYSNQTVYNRAYFDGGSSYYSSSLYMQWLDGTWMTVGNWLQEGSQQASWNGSGITWPYWSSRRTTELMQAVDGTPPTYDVLVLMPTPRQSIAMAFEGIQWTPGFGVSDESTFTDQTTGKLYTVFQNVYRSSNRDYMALLCA